MSEKFISINDAEKDLLTAAAYVAERVGGSDDRADAGAAVVQRYLARGEVDLAAELANSLDDPFMRDRLLIAVATKCADLDDDEYALQLADAIEEQGLQSQAREMIALQKAKKGEIEAAREIASSIFHPDAALAGIAAKQAEMGDTDAATETLAEIDYPGASVMALMSMAAGRLERGEKEAAVEYLETAASLAEEIEHDEERIRALIDVGNAMTDAGRRDRAVQTLDKAMGYAEALDNVHRDNFLAGVSQAFMHAGSEDLADRALDLVADKTQIATALVGFAREYWRKEDRDEAFEALDEAYEILRSQRDRETRDSKARYGLFGTIAAQYAGFERGERAIEIAEGIEDDQQSMAALGQIAGIMTLQKNDELARQALNAIPEEAERMLALISMSDAARENGENEKASEFINEAIELAKDVPQLSARSAAYAEIASRLLDREDPTRAREVMLIDLENIAQIRGQSTRAMALATLAGLFDKAEFKLNESEAELVRTILVPKSF